MLETRDYKTKVDAYCDRLENLSLDNLPGLLDLCSTNIEFKDPFNNTHTLTGFQSVLKDMFAQIPNATFDVTALHGAGQNWVIKWQFRGHAGRLGNLDFPGMSEIVLNDQAKICRHIDYWDSGEYFWSKIPILGFLISQIKRRFKVG